MKKGLALFLIGALLVQLPVFATGFEPVDATLSCGGYTDQELIEELHGALLERKITEVSKILGSNHFGQ